VLVFVMAIGQAGIFSGAWLVERFTGSRAAPAREEIARGLDALERRKAMNQDAGTAILLDQRITEAQSLTRLTDPELEDYLWKQQAHVNQPLVAYTKLRITRGPVVKLGPEAKPMDVPVKYIPAILGAEMLLALWLASRGVLATR
jgi:hypothetical protein